MTTATTYTGEWRQLDNISADSKGSIHDDSAARGLGFRGGFVPGSVVGTVALEGAIAVLGEGLFEGGWYDLTFVSPVYTDDEVRAVTEPAGDGLSLRVETRDGRLCCSGRAGMGNTLPWPDTATADATVLPRVEIGAELRGGAFSVTPVDIESLLRGSGEDSAWYCRGSPWGGPVVPPERLHRIALDVSRTVRLEIDGVRQPGMWAGHALVMRAPLMLGRVYKMTEHVVDKGRSGRAVFLTYEFRVTSTGGHELAVGRHKVKWLAADGE
jgi:hypothetical protein